MKHSTKIFLSMLLVCSLGALIATSTNAATSNLGTMLNQAAGAEGAGYDTSVSGESALAKTAGIIVRAFISLIGIIFISYTIYGGFLWMTAAGKEDQITKSKNIIRDGIIGIIIILGAAAIYYFIFNALNQGSTPGAGATG
jgi:hypothetical protein